MFKEYAVVSCLEKGGGAALGVLADSLGDEPLFEILFGSA